MRYLYQKKYESAYSDDCVNDFLNSCKVEEFRISPFHYKFKFEKITFKEFLSRLYFGIITGWRSKIYILLDKENVVHTSYVVPKCFKFPFLEKNDYEIGPCVTKKDYRRQGCYNYMLRYISTLPCYSKANFYMIVNATNVPSIRGIEKVGFDKCGTVEKTYFLKIYKKQ